MTNEEMLLRALTGEELTVTEFHPQNNKQAYLAYAVGFITDPSLLPEPRTNEEVLLLEVCLNGGGGGTVLPTLTNPATAAQLLLGFEAISQSGEKMTGTYEPFVLPTLDSPAEVDQILEGYQAINRKGLVVTGMMEDNSGRWYSAAVDLENGTVNVPRGFHDGITGVQIEVEEKVVTPSDAKQEITPSRGAVLGKVIIEPASGGCDLEITDASMLFYNGARAGSINELVRHIKGCTTMRSMFQGFNKVFDFDATLLDTSQVTDMMYAFNSCATMTDLDASGWDTSKVTTMSNMFTNSGLTGIDVSGWDTSNVADMNYMFVGCYSLENIIGFSATNKAGMNNIFPYGSTASACKLKRLTFRTDLPEGTYSIRSAINIKYCSFDRDGMVEMFNTLPDVSALGLSSSNKTITITGNPCVTDGSLTEADKLIATNKGWTLVT